MNFRIKILQKLKFQLIWIWIIEDLLYYGHLVAEGIKNFTQEAVDIDNFGLREGLNLYNSGLREGIHARQSSRIRQQNSLSA